MTSGVMPQAIHRNAALEVITRHVALDPFKVVLHRFRVLDLGIIGSIKVVFDGAVIHAVERHPCRICGGCHCECECTDRRPFTVRIFAIFCPDLPVIITVGKISLKRRAGRGTTLNVIVIQFRGSEIGIVVQFNLVAGGIGYDSPLKGNIICGNGASIGG